MTQATILSIVNMRIGMASQTILGNWVHVIARHKNLMNLCIFVAHSAFVLRQRFVTSKAMSFFGPICVVIFWCCGQMAIAAIVSIVANYARIAVISCHDSMRTLPPKIVVRRRLLRSMTLGASIFSMADRTFVCVGNILVSSMLNNPIFVMILRFGVFV
jgi:hypothetical protein